MTSFQQFILKRYCSPENIPLFSFSPIDFLSIQKYADLKTHLNNPFMTSTTKDYILDIFNNIQRLIWAVSSIKRSWLYKRAKIYNTEDLLLAPISRSDKNVFVLFRNRTKYVFQLRELIRTLTDSLCHCCHFFPSPTVCKNPYTNMALNKSDLYNIYFAIRSSNYAMPFLFEKYFRSNFHLEQFSMENQDIINEEYLKSFVENNYDDIYELTRNMFHDNQIKCNIHKSFPKEILLKIMKPYLDLFIISQYSIDMSKKIQAYRLLHRKLHHFTDFNPNFGKRKVRIVKKNPFDMKHICQYYYDENCIPFHSLVETGDFMKSHLGNENGIIHRRNNQIVNQLVNTEEDTEEDSEEEDVEEEEDEEDEVVIITERSRQWILEDTDDEEDEVIEEDEDE
jgi:hypothetical protein